MLSEAARAKINLGLAVTARRGDGFHELDTIFALLNLSDELQAEAADELLLEVEAESGLPGTELLRSDDNLVLAAAAAFMTASGAPGAHFRLLKRIPLAAGLGGGSADAAATLRLMARLWPEHAAEVDLMSLARDLGSDVPFMLMSVPAAHGRGRGERLEALQLIERHVVLANPGVAVSAGQAYSWLQSFSRRLDLERISAALASGEEPRWQNALMAGVSREVREVREVITALRACGLQGVIMSGSGSTCFGLAASEAAAEQAATELRQDHPDWWVRADRVGAGLP